MRFASQVRRRSRLNVLSTLLCLCTALFVASGCNSSDSKSSGSGGTINVYAATDVNEATLWKTRFIPAFEKQNPGYKVKYVYDAEGANTSSTLARIVSSAKANRKSEMDLLDGALVRGNLTPFLVKVTADNVPNLGSVPPSLLEPVSSHAVPLYGSNVMIVYNSEQVEEAPETLADVIEFIRANPGKFAYNTPASGGAGASFVETVVSQWVPEDVQAAMIAGKSSPDDEKYFDKGLSALHELTPKMYQGGAYPNGNQAPLDLLGRGEIWMAPAWSDMTLASMLNGQLGPEFKTAQITEPTLTGGTVFISIPSNAANKDAALKLANFVLEPEQQGALVEVMKSHPVIPEDTLPAAAKKTLARQDYDPTKFHPDYSADVYDNLARLWQQQVP
jgi:putative spermidine/putrescine transport system substrate-binding protein